MVYQFIEWLLQQTKHVKINSQNLPYTSFSFSCCLVVLFNCLLVVVKTLKREGENERTYSGIFFTLRKQHIHTYCKQISKYCISRYAILKSSNQVSESKPNFHIHMLLPQMQLLFLHYFQL